MPADLEPHESTDPARRDGPPISELPPALATGLIPANAAEYLDRPTRWRRLPGLMSARQVKQLLEAPLIEAASQSNSGSNKKHRAPLWMRDRALLELLYACGLRASEAADL